MLFGNATSAAALAAAALLRGFAQQRHGDAVQGSAALGLAYGRFRVLLDLHKAGLKSMWAGRIFGLTVASKFLQGFWWPSVGSLACLGK